MRNGCYGADKDWGCEVSLVLALVLIFVAACFLSASNDASIDQRVRCLNFWIGACFMAIAVALTCVGAWQVAFYGY